MFTILAMTGMRAGEMLGLQWGDIDFAAACIHIRRSAWYGNVQRGSGASAGVFGCNSASISGAMEAESARIFVRDAEQSAPLLQQGRAVRFVARAGRAEDSSLRASCIPAHARKFALAHGSHAESCAGTVAAR